MNAQQLKNSILQEAIQGRLVPQDPTDEPASVLLQRIRKEKERLVKEGKLKKKDLECKPIEDNEIPFEIPKGWEWVRLGDIGIFERGNGIKRDETQEIGYPCVRYGEMYTHYRYSPTFTITRSYTSRCVFEKCRKAHSGDIFMALTGENKQDIALAAQYIGKKEVAVGGDLCHFTVLNAFALYFVYLINSAYFSNKKEGLATGDIIVHISTDKLASIPIPLPPLAEQRRIVAKIEELMPIVEKYGKAQAELEELNRSLPEKLKKSVLQEAIQGRLVPQDPTDEPASVLIERIRKEKERLVKEGKLKKKDLESKPIEEDEIPFEIPVSWGWIRGKDLFAKMQSVKPTGDTFKYIDIDAINNKTNTYIAKIIKTENAPSRATRHTQNGDVLFSMVRPYLKNITIVKENNCIASTGFYVCRPYKVCSDYCFWLMLSPYVVDGLNQNMKGDNSPSVNNNDIENYLFPLPPLAEQKRIVAKIEELFCKIEGLKG